MQGTSSFSADVPQPAFQRDWTAYIAEARARHRQGDFSADRYDDTLILCTEVDRLHAIMDEIAELCDSEFAEDMPRRALVQIYGRCI